MIDVNFMLLVSAGVLLTYREVKAASPTLEMKKRKPTNLEKARQVTRSSDHAFTTRRPGKRFPSSDARSNRSFALESMAEA